MGLQPLIPSGVEAAIAASDWEQAAAGLRELVAQRPCDPSLLSQLSYVESYRGNYRSARDIALRASRHGPPSLEVARDVMARLRTFNEVEALSAYVARMGPASRLPIPLLLAAASQFGSLNEQTRALAMLDEARRGDPEYPATLIARGHVLMYLGRLGEAESELRQAMARAPEVAQSYWLLAQVAVAKPGDSRVDQIRRLLARSPPPADAALLGFALHKELDDLGDHAGAWQALEQACAVKRGGLRYCKEDSRILTEALIGMRLTAPPMAPTQHARAPIFIVGMHRSGTTLLEQLLDAHPRVRGIGEMYDFTSAMRYATGHHCQGVIDPVIVEGAPRADLAQAGQRYLDGLAWRLGEQTHFTDKLPSNFLNLGFICHALPQAKVLHMVRDPVETCFSNLRELFSNANPYSYDQDELADYFVQYRRLMAHWHQLYPGRILDVDYARLTADPASAMRQVAAFCGLEYLDAMRSTASSKRPVATASAVQVRGDVVRRERPKWQPYAEWLQPMMRRLPAA